jgi:hypothetical protein
MSSDRLSDFLMMVIFILGSMCGLRWMYLNAPDEPDAQPQVQLDDWAPPVP